MKDMKEIVIEMKKYKDIYDIRQIENLDLYDKNAGYGWICMTFKDIVDNINDFLELCNIKIKYYNNVKYTFKINGKNYKTLYNI